MKKLLFIFTIALLIIGCTAYNQHTKEYYCSDHNVVEIDSCEYVLITISTGTKNYSDIIHKGNCKFCEKRQKKFYTEIVDSMFIMQD